MIFSLCFFEAMNNIKIDYSTGSEEPEIDNWQPYLDQVEPGIFAHRTESNHCHPSDLIRLIWSFTNMFSKQTSESVVQLDGDHKAVVSF